MSSRNNLSDIPLWYDAVNRLVKNISTLGVVHYSEIISNGNLEYGGVSQWQVFLSEDLRSMKETNSIQYLQFISLPTTNTITYTTCTDNAQAKSILSLLVNYMFLSSSLISTSILCDGNYWVLKNCRLSVFDVKFCINCVDPCFVDLHNTEAAISYGCNNLDSCAHILEVKFVDVNPPAEIVNMDVLSVRRNSIIIEVYTSEYSIVQCGTTTVQIGDPSLVTNITFSNMAQIQFLDLEPSTTYGIKCTTISVTGAALKSEAELIVSTLCCKDAFLSITYLESFAAYRYFNVLSFSLSSNPSDNVSFSFSLQPTKSNYSLCSTTVLDIANSNPSPSFSISIECPVILIPGIYEFAVHKMGDSAAEYRVHFLTSNVFRVSNGSFSGQGTSPVLLSATFSDTGTAVIVTFSRSTNRAFLPTTFNCSLILRLSTFLSFPCQWMDDKSIKVYLKGGEEYVNVGEIINLSSSTTISALKSSCPDGYDCTNWPSISPNQSVAVKKPMNPIQPQIVVSGPKEVQSCSSLIIDLSSSSGQAGRLWTALSVRMQTTSSDIPGNVINNIERSVEASLRNNSFLRAFIPIDSLTIGGQYSFYFTLCNWLQQCGSASYFFAISGSQVPDARIIGPTIKQIFVYNPLTINAMINFSVCNEFIAYAVHWSIFDNAGFQLSSISSISNDSSIFLLRSNSLAPNKTYQVMLAVTNMAAAVTTTSIVTILVYPLKSSDLVPIISQGSVLNVRGGSSFNLDASMSYDRTLESDKRKPDSALSYSWHCNLISANIKDNYCDMKMIASGPNNSSVTLFPTPVSGVVLFQMVLIISKQGLSNYAYIRINVSDDRAASCQIRIDPIPVSLPVNVGRKLRLSATGSTSEEISLAWKISDLDIQKISFGESTKYITSTEPFIKSNQTIPFTFDISIRPNALQAGSSYTLSLLCVSMNSFKETNSAIQIFTNMAPMPGNLKIVPNSGLELREVFLFYATGWYSEELPLLFKFGFFANGLSQFLPITSYSEISYASSILPSGNVHNSNELSCAVWVLDSMGSNSSIGESVTVIPRSNLLISETILNDVLSTNSIYEAKSLIGIYGSILNYANCSNAPNCSILNRDPCLKSDRTCGSCKSGYIGIAGDSNSLCVMVSDRRRLQEKSSCKSDKDCGLFHSCSAGSCIAVNQTCINSCSGHGRCSFKDVRTGLPIKSCNYFDLTCTATCSCDNYYYGVSCEVGREEQMRQVTSRCALVQGLYQMLPRDNIDTHTVSDWINLLANTVSDSWSTTNCIGEVMSTIAFILSASIRVNLPYESLLVLSGPLNSVLQFGSLNDNVRNLIIKWSTVMAAELVANQSIATVAKEFRIVTVAIDFSRNITLNEPQNANEIVSPYHLPQQYSMSVPISFSDWLVISMVTFRASLLESFGANSNEADVFINSYSSPPVLLKIAHRSVNIVLQNIEHINSNSSFLSTSFHATCHNNLITSHQYHCPYSHSPVFVNCTGTAYSVDVECPTYKYASVCSFINTSSFSRWRYTCEETRSNIETTTCSCSPNSTVVVSSPSDFTILLATKKVVILSEHSESVNKLYAPSGTSFISTLMIICAGVCYAALILAIFTPKMLRRLLDKADIKIAAAKTKISAAVEYRGVEESIVTSHKFKIAAMWKLPFGGLLSTTLKSSLQHAIPDHLQMSRLFSVLRRYHKYLAIFMQDEKVQMQSLVSIVSHSNFVLLSISTCIYMLFHVDKSCESLKSASSCDLGTSVFDSYEGKCRWDSFYNTCGINIPVDSFRTMVLINFIAQLISVVSVVCFDEISASMIWSVNNNTIRVGVQEPVPIIGEESKESNDNEAEEMDRLSQVSLETELANFELLVLSHQQRSFWKLENDVYTGNVYCYLSGLYKYKEYFNKIVSQSQVSSSFKAIDFRSVLHELRSLTSEQVNLLNHFDIDTMRYRILSKLIFDLLPNDSSSIYDSYMWRTGRYSRLLYNWQKSFGIFCLVSFNIFVFVFNAIFVSRLTPDEVLLWIRAFLLWLLFDVILFSTLFVVAAYVIVPSTIVKDLQSSIQQIQAAAIYPFFATPSNLSRTTKTDHLLKNFIPSIRIAKFFPNILEARIVSFFDPEKSMLKGIFSHNPNVLARSSFSKLLRTFSGALSSVYIFIQNLVLLVLVYGISIVYLLVYVELYNVSPSLIVVPAVCTITLVYVNIFKEYQTVLIDVSDTSIEAAYAFVDLVDVTNNMKDLQDKCGTANVEKVLETCEATQQKINSAPLPRLDKMIYNYSNPLTRHYQRHGVNSRLSRRSAHNQLLKLSAEALSLHKTKSSANISEITFDYDAKSKSEDIRRNSETSEEPNAFIPEMFTTTSSIIRFSEKFKRSHGPIVSGRSTSHTLGNMTEINSSVPVLNKKRKLASVPTKLPILESASDDEDKDQESEISGENKIDLAVADCNESVHDQLSILSIDASSSDSSYSSNVESKPPLANANHSRNKVEINEALRTKLGEAVVLNTKTNSPALRKALQSPDSVVRRTVSRPANRILRSNPSSEKREFEFPSVPRPVLVEVSSSHIAEPPEDTPGQTQTHSAQFAQQFRSETNYFTEPKLPDLNKIGMVPENISLNSATVRTIDAVDNGMKLFEVKSPIATESLSPVATMEVMYMEDIDAEGFSSLRDMEPNFVQETISKQSTAESKSGLARGSTDKVSLLDIRLQELRKRVRRSNLGGRQQSSFAVTTRQAVSTSNHQDNITNRQIGASANKKELKLPSASVLSSTETAIATDILTSQRPPVTSSAHVPIINRNDNNNNKSNVQRQEKLQASNLLQHVDSRSSSSSSSSSSSAQSKL